MRRWLILFLLLLAQPALAESLVVQNCGTLPLAYKPGTTRADTIDVNGMRCTNGAGGGGISATVNGAQSNAGSNATSSANVPSNSYIYGFNNVSGQWDQLQDDANKNLLVALAGSGIQTIATGTTGAVVATLPGVASRTTQLCNLDITAIGGTAAISPVTIAGLLGGSMIYYNITSAVAGVNFSRTFTPCLVASAANTAITITTTADGTATAVNVMASGMQR